MNADQSKIKREWAEKGYSFGIWKDSPDQIWFGFVHATDEIIMLVEGKIEIEFQGRKISPKIGEEVVIPAGVKHTVKNIGKSNNIWFYGYRIAQKK